MNIWPDPSVPPVELEVPAGTIAVVWLRRDVDGGLLASYGETRTYAPAPREQVAAVLEQLAAALLEQADELDREASR